MAIKDVSKQWALMLESEAEEQKKYCEACEEAEKRAEELKERELEDIDEEELDPAELGFTEEEVKCNEVVDPLQMWKDMKRDERGALLMKVDNNYINKMKKLLSRIKSSKSQLYHQLIDVKLPEYMRNGTQLPCPEDFAENFIPFEQIDRASADRLGDPRGAEVMDTSDDLAAQNMYDSELTEAEEADVKKEFNAACERAQEATKKDPKQDEVKKYISEHRAEIEKNVKKLDSEAQDRVLKIVKILEKWADGELVAESRCEEELDEAKKKSSIPLATLKLLFRFLNLFVFGIPCLAGKGLKLLGGVGGYLDKYSKRALDSIDDKLAESVALEVEDDKQALEEADAEVLDAEGNPVNEEFIEDIEEEEVPEEVERGLKEADEREAASHLLDPVGVKASTASLKAQDTAMLTVVESLVKRIEKMDAKLNEAKWVPDDSTEDLAARRAMKEFGKFARNGGEKIVVRFEKQGMTKVPFVLEFRNNSLVFIFEESTKNIELFDELTVEQFVDSCVAAGCKDTTAIKTIAADSDEFRFSTVSMNAKEFCFYFEKIDLKKKKLTSFFTESCCEEEKQEVEEAEYIDVDDFFKEDETSEEVNEAEVTDMEKFLDSEEVEEADESKLMTAEEFVGEADTSFDDENGEEEEDPAAKAKEEEIQKAIKRIKFFQELSYERELKKNELDEFRELFNKIPEDRRYEIDLPLEKSGFARPSNHTGVFVTDIGGSGERVEVPPFNPNATALNFKDKDEEKQEEIKFPERGSRKTWTTAEWNAFLSSIDPKKREDLMNDLIADIEAMTPEEAEAASSPELKGKPTDMQKAHQVSFIKSVFGKYTSGKKIKIDTRDLGRMLGKSHAGVGKYANETLEMIRDAIRRATGKRDPSIADFNSMDGATYNKVKQYLEIAVNSKQRRKNGVDASVAPLPNTDEFKKKDTEEGAE